MNNITEAIIKINLKKMDGTIKMCTGIFYNPYINGVSNTQPFIILPKHAIYDDYLQSLELIYFYNSKKMKVEISLSDYDELDILTTDLTIIRINKPIYYSYLSRVTDNTIFKSLDTNTTNIIHLQGFVPGFYDKYIDTPIYEHIMVCSNYNLNHIYIKSQYINKGYSGAPVFIFIPNTADIKLLGFVSKNCGNDNIEIVPADNLILAKGAIIKQFTY